MIALDPTKCMGCLACSNVCPSKNIIREDGERRVIRFAKCEEFCDICVEFCPQNALKLADKGEDDVIIFDLVICKICGSRFATEPMLNKVRSLIPAHLQKDSTGLSWIEICPSCRKDIERERSASQILLMRR